jgi:hypothetical protein
MIEGTKSSKTELAHDLALVAVISVLAAIAWSLSHLTSKKFWHGPWPLLILAILAVIVCFALYYFDAMK